MYRNDKIDVKNTVFFMCYISKEEGAALFYINGIIKIVI